MLDKIAKLLDFNPDKHTVESIIEEFNHKYQSSWMFVNDKPARNAGLYYTNGGLVLQIENLGAKRLSNIKILTSIKPFLPKTGLYYNDTFLIYLRRIPERQWVKSYKYNSNYTYDILDMKENQRIPFNAIEFLFHKDTTWAPETVIFNNNVFLHWLKVGKVELDTQKIILSNKRFEKEIAELWTQYQITLAAPTQKKFTAQRLNLDF